MVRKRLRVTACSIAAAVALCPVLVLGAGQKLVVQMPPGAKAQAAIASAPRLKLESKGSIRDDAITFDDLLPDTSYDVRITLADGTILQGVDMSWHSDEPAKDAAPLDEDDRSAITTLFEGIKAFENKRKMLMMAGNHQRVTILAELTREAPFYGSRGDEVIWRVELWYFKNQHGGWERVQQASKVLRRERFRSRAEFQQTTGKLKWISELGGISISAAEAAKTVRIAAIQGDR